MQTKINRNNAVIFVGTCEEDDTVDLWKNKEFIAFVARVIRRMRRAQNLTQNEVGKRSELTGGTISNMENNRFNHDSGLWIAVLHALGTQSEYVQTAFLMKKGQEVLNLVEGTDGLLKVVGE